MARCVLIIEAGPERTVGGVFKPGSLESLEFITAAGKSLQEGLSAVVADFAAKGYRPAKVLLSIHPSLVSIRVLDIPIPDKKKIEEVLSFQAEDLFLERPGELIMEALPLYGGKTAVAAVEKKALEEQLQILREAGLFPDWAGPAMFSMDRLIKKAGKGNGACALIGDGAVAAVRDGVPCFFKHIASAGDLKFAAAAMEADGTVIDEFYTAGTWAAAAAQAAGINASDIGSENAAIDALALHLKEGLRDGVDFLSGYTDPKAAGALGRKKKTAVALCAAIAVLLNVYAFARYENNIRESARLSAEADRGFQELFPGEKVRNPEYALETKLKQLETERALLSGKADALKAMLGLSKAAGGGSAVSVRQVQLSGGRLNVSSEAGSVDDAVRFRDSMARSGYFSEVALKDTKTAPGRVDFSVTASMEGR